MKMQDYINNLKLEDKERAKKDKVDTSLTPIEDKLEKPILSFQNGEPHGVVDGKYVPYADALISFQKKKIIKEQNKLDILLINA